MKKPNTMLLVFSAMSFVLAMTAFVFSGILDKVAVSLGISVAQSGLLNTMYSYGAAFGVPITLILFRKIENVNCYGCINQNAPGLCRPAQVKCKEAIHNKWNTSCCQVETYTGQLVAVKWRFCKNRNELVAGSQYHHRSPAQCHCMRNGKGPGIEMMPCKRLRRIT